MATTEKRTAETTTDETIKVKDREILVHTRGTAKNGRFSIHAGPSVLAHGRSGATGLSVQGGSGNAPQEAMDAVRAAFGLPSAAEVAKTEKATAKAEKHAAAHPAKHA